MSYVVRRRHLIDNLQELPKEEQPPSSLYFDDMALEEWFNRKNSGAQNIINLQIDDIEE
jgi:hypothetical protein